jgi:hypothetical protein
MTENPGKLVPLGIVHIDNHRDQLMQLIETRWQDGRLALWGRRKDTSHPFEKIKKYKGLELVWMAGSESDDYYCDVKAHPSVIGKRGYYQHLWEEIQIREEDLKLLCAEIAETAPGTETASQSDSIPLMEAVHDLRIAHRTDLRSAIREMTDLLATGQLPPAEALVDGRPAKIDPRWWWAGAIEYPNSSAAFNLIIDAEPRLTRATEIALDRRAWERQRSRIAATAQQGDGSISHRDDPAWEQPVKLFDAIGLWSPAFAWRLDELNWVSPDEIRDIAGRLRDYDHPTRVYARRARAKRQRDQDPNRKVVREGPHDSPDVDDDRGFPGSLRDDWARLLKEWDQWDDAERLVGAFELAAHLIIENTKSGRPYLLEYAPPASHGDLSADYLRVGEARHEGLGPYDLNVRSSLIRNPGGNWLPVRVSGGIDAEAERMRADRLAHEAHDAAAKAVWKAECVKPRRERQYFRFGDIADALATDPESLDIDAAKRDRIVRDLADWTSRGEFDLSADSEVVILSGEPPHFLPLGPVRPHGVFANPDELILRRNACRRYLLNSSLTSAARLLKHWFAETTTTAFHLRSAVNAVLRKAVQDALSTLGMPGKTLQWKTFCDDVRSACRVTMKTRGYSDKSIQRAVTTVKAEQDKLDKQDK